MATAARDALGTVVSLWRYPVKSMMGEELNASEVTDRGLLGDRAYALVDPSTGKVASAKNPRKWLRLFDFRAAYAEPPQGGRSLPSVRITFPDGSHLRTDDSRAESAIAQVLGAPVKLMASAPDQVSLEEYWPDIEGLAHRETVTDETMPPNTFFDAATIHILTTGTVNRLRQLYPEGRFEVRRFRPNIVVEVPQMDFVENEWVGNTLALGEDVRVKVAMPCGRCVMTTLPQGDLPRDPGILKAAAKHNKANVGVYGSVVRGGSVRRGDLVRRE